MARAITFSTKVSRSNGSFSSFIFSMLNKLLTKNTKNGRVAAIAATKDIAPSSVALVSEIDATGTVSYLKSTREALSQTRLITSYE